MAPSFLEKVAALCGSVGIPDDKLLLQMINQLKEQLGMQPF